MKKIIWIPLVIIAAAAVLCFFYFRTEDPAEVARDTLNAVFGAFMARISVIDEVEGVLITHS